jgi:16S rRNA (cytidine1402-2'-O)-methyltransferase
MLAYHEHNEARSVPRLLERLERGDDLALVSDAGTPLLSDPGARLTRAAIERGLAVIPVPGASALLAALTGSGFDADRFTYFGFLPRQGRLRSEAIAAIAATAHVVVIYEAPLRVAATLRDLSERDGGTRRAVVARELTKRFEEFRRGTVSELAAYYGDDPPRGEVVILLGPAETPPLDEQALAETARGLRAAGLTARDCARRLMEEHGVPRNRAYRLAQEAAE